jgi:hypothetical protein
VKAAPDAELQLLERHKPLLRFDRVPGEPVVCGSTFNRLRQRSDVAEAVPSPEGPA